MTVTLRKVRQYFSENDEDDEEIHVILLWVNIEDLFRVILILLILSCC